MSQLSSYVATVFHSTTGLPIQAFYCQFDLSEAKLVCHVLLSPAFISHADCKQIWGFFLHLWSLFSLHNYFRCLDLVWLQQQICLPHYFPFPVKLSSLLCFFKSRLSVKWKHLGFAFKIFVQFSTRYISVFSPIFFCVLQLLVFFP